MSASRASRVVLRVATALTLALHLLPAGDHHPLRLQRRTRPSLADHELDDRMVRPSLRRRGGPRRADPVGPDRRRRHRRGHRPGDAPGLRRPALLVLRPGDRLLPGDPADRPAGDRHGHRPQLRVPRHRHPPGNAHGGGGPRDVLRRHDLQQCDRPAAPHVALPRRGVHGPGRRLAPDVPPRHLPGDGDLARGRRPARPRPLVRRGDRHELHGRPAADAADLDPLELPPPEPGAAGERGGRAGGPHLGHPDLPRLPAQLGRWQRGLGHAKRDATGADEPDGAGHAALPVVRDVAAEEERPARASGTVYVTVSVAPDVTTTRSPASLGGTETAGVGPGVGPPPVPRPLARPPGPPAGRRRARGCRGHRSRRSG